MLEELHNNHVDGNTGERVKLDLFDLRELFEKLGIDCVKTWEFMVVLHYLYNLKKKEKIAKISWDFKISVKRVQSWFDSILSNEINLSKAVGNKNNQINQSKPLFESNLALPGKPRNFKSETVFDSVEGPTIPENQNSDPKPDESAHYDVSKKIQQNLQDRKNQKSTHTSDFPLNLASKGTGRAKTPKNQAGRAPLDDSMDESDPGYDNFLNTHFANPHLGQLTKDPSHGQNFQKDTLVHSTLNPEKKPTDRIEVSFLISIDKVINLELPSSYDYCDFSLKYYFPLDEESIESHAFTYVPDESHYDLNIKSEHLFRLNQELDILECMASDERGL